MPQEIGVWAKAKRLSYINQLALEEGFQAEGVEYFTFPSVCFRGGQNVLKGKSFDQVWVQVVHSPLDEEFLEQIRQLAPVRVAIVEESLEHTEEEFAQWPALRGREEKVRQRLPFFTHAIANDERDAKVLNSESMPTFWWPFAIPQKQIIFSDAIDFQAPVIFSGDVYAKREKWVNDPMLKKYFVYFPPVDGSLYPSLFNLTHFFCLAFLKLNLPFKESFLRGVYSPSLSFVRKKILRGWLMGLRRGSAVVNLPSVFKGYTTRVLESMAAGRPVIAWEIPHRPLSNALFEKGKEILTFEEDQPEQLIQHIQHLKADAFFAQRMIRNARRKIEAFHTVEKRVRDFLSWLDSGKLPTYS
ncbi:MAG: glycosyltransferase [Candidatus Omnitrophica bacterium]|nr:glycosyltransferase [Candidatus Omnitrophota bacterium]